MANSRHDRVVLRRICLAWEGLTGVAIEPQAVSAAAALVGGDFLRAWVEVTAAAGAGSSEIVLNHLRSELVDALRFPETVERFLDGQWRAWNSDDVGEDGDDPVEEEIRTWKALHRDIVSEYGSNAGKGDVDPDPGADLLRVFETAVAVLVGDGFGAIAVPSSPQKPGPRNLDEYPQTSRCSRFVSDRGAVDPRRGHLPPGIPTAVVLMVE